MQKSPILQNPIYPRNITDLTDFTDFTDLQLTDFWPTGRSYNNSYDFFSGCRVAAALRTRVGVVFRTRVAAGRADWAAEGVVRVEKYTARRDLTADGVDFESLCEWTNNYEQWRWYHEQAAPAASIIMMKPATMIQ